MTSAATADFPAITFEVALDDGTGVAATTFTDFTNWLMAGGTTTGRQRQLEAFDPGTAWFDLDNSDGRFDPLNAAGPYFGKLKPLRQCRIRAGWPTVGTTYDVWRGYIDGWPQSYPEYGLDAVVKLTATDGFLLLQRSKLPDSVWAATVAALAPTGWYRLGEEAGTLMGDSSTSKRHGVYFGGATFNHRASSLNYAKANGSIAFDGGDQVGVVPLDVLPVTGPYTYACWLRIPDPIRTDVYTVAIAGSSGRSKNDQRSLLLLIDPFAGAPDLVATNAWNDDGGVAPRTVTPIKAGGLYFVAVTFSGSVGGLELWVNGVVQNETGATPGALSGTVKDSLFIGGAGDADGIPWNAELGEVILVNAEWVGGEVGTLYHAAVDPWDGDTSGARISRLATLAGWPSALLSLNAGTSILGPATLGGTALDAMQLIERTEAGLLYIDPTGKLTLVGRTNLRNDTRFTTSQGTFGPGTGELPYSDVVTSGWDWASIWNAARVARDGGAVQEYSDATSIADYGESYADDETDLLMRTDGEALDRAAWKVLRFKDPAFRVDAITLRPRQPTSTVTGLLWPQVLGRAIGDRVTVKVDPIGSAALTQTCHIESIAHRFAPLEWETIFGLSAIDPNEAVYAVAGSGAARNRVGTAKAGY